MQTLVRSASLTRYFSLAPALGIDPVSIVSRAGVDQACLHVPDLRIPERCLADVLEASAKTSNCQALGLQVAETWRLSDFGPLSLLLKHQPTLRQVLVEIEDYRHLLSDSVIVQEEDFNEIAVVRAGLVTGRPDAGRQAVELTVGVLFSLMRAILGQGWKPRSVHLSHSAPENMRIHRRVFGTDVEFDCEFDGIVISQQDLDRVNPLADATLARYARGFLDLQPRTGQDAVGANVRRTIHLLLPKGIFAIEQVGQSLGMSPRTMQRRLMEAGENFSSLVNEVRCELAQRYLGNQRHSVSQVAMLLGFSETSAFSRWFSAQFGRSPTRWRNDAFDCADP